MINPFHEINWRPAQTDLRKFAWSLIIGFPCLAVAFFLMGWLHAGHLPPLNKFLFLAGGGVVAGVICLLVPPVARPLYYVWYAIAACMGLVVSNLILIVIYYAIFTPVALFLRLRGRDALGLKWRRDSATFWRDAPAPPPAADYFRQY